MTVAGRVLTGVLTGAALLLGAVGVVAVPGLLPCWIVLGAVGAAVSYTWLVERTAAESPDARMACRHRSVVVGVVTVVGCTVIVGLLVLFGALSGPVVLVLVLAGAPRMWRGLRRAWTPAAPLPAPASEASTTELCLAWRRSYLALLDTPAGPDRDRIVGLRRDLLDELARRDPDGFSRWLDTGARADGDPSRHLRSGR